MIDNLTSSNHGVTDNNFGIQSELYAAANNGGQTSNCDQSIDGGGPF